MDKEAFRGLSVEEQVKYINGLLEQGYSLRQACDSIPTDRATLGKKFKRSGYVFAEHRYKLQTNYEGNNENYNGNNSAHKSNYIDYKSNNDELLNNYESNNEIHETSNSEDLLTVTEVHKSNNEELQKKHKSNNTNYESNEKVIEELQRKVNEVYEWYLNENEATIKRKLYLMEFESEVVNRTYKIYSEVLEDFNEFCKNNKQYKVQDIISHALREFLDKYY